MRTLFLLYLMILPLFLTAQCDEDLTPISGRMGYQSRGKHCEGFYRSLVSAYDIQLVHFTKGRLSYSSTEAEKVKLSIPVQTETPANIRGMGIPRNVYYRMDATLPYGQSLVWNTQTVLLGNASTKYARLVGLLGFTEDHGRRVYVPVQINEPENQSLLIKLVASTTVKQLKWRLRGKTAYTPIRDGRSFLAGRAIPISLPQNLPAGEYTLQIVGKDRSGVKDVTEVIQIKI